MRPHSDHYSHMFVITCDYGKPMVAIERLLQIELKLYAPGKVPHEGYRKGPVTDDKPIFLYLCCACPLDVHRAQH